MERAGGSEIGGEGSAALECGAVEIEGEVAGLIGAVESDDDVLAAAGSAAVGEAGGAREDEGGGINEEILLKARSQDRVIVAEME